jgi:hypothetical protein
MDITIVEALDSSIKLFKRRPFMPKERYNEGLLSLCKSRCMPLKIIGGSYFSAGTFKKFKSSLLI